MCKDITFLNLHKKLRSIFNCAATTQLLAGTESYIQHTYTCIQRKTILQDPIQKTSRVFLVISA